MEVLSPVT
jgi:polo-like kinase 1